MTKRQHSLELGVIGNGTFAALVDDQARIVWTCLPRFDGDPVFCDLLEPAIDAGFFAIELDGFSHASQHYVHNSAILVTRLEAADGSA